MADSEQRIREMVRAALQEDPAITNRVLLERAREIDPAAVAGLSMRQFHGRFRLPVARAMSTGTSRKRQARRSRTPSSREPVAAPERDAARDALRDVFRRFAVQLASAESRLEIVSAASRIDEYVEEALRTLAPEPAQAPAKRTRRRRRVESAPRRPEEQVGDTSEPGGRLAAEAAASALAETVPGRDMRRRRRPRALVEARPNADEGTAAQDETPAEQDIAAVSPPLPAVDERPEEPAARGPEERTSVFSLSDDLEEFRRRRAERPWGRPKP